MLNRGLEGASSREIKEIEAELKKLGPAIKAHRQQAGLSQEKLAELLDINVNTIKYIEQGRRIPSIPMLLRICWKIDFVFKLGARD